MANKEERIAGIIRKSISEIITMELKNPHLGFVTIPEVKVSKDFSYAKVYVSFMFEEQIEEGKISKKAYECYLKLLDEAIFKKERYSR